MKKLFTTALVALIGAASMFAAQVTVKMNSTSRTMTLVNKATNTPVETGEATSYAYTFEAEAGTYVLTSYASNGTTVNGTLEITVTADAEQTFTVQTCTAYATNKTDNVAWQYGSDYTIDVAVSGKDGSPRVLTLGNSTTAGRKTFNVLNGDSYTATFVPSVAHVAENYLPLVKTGTVTANPTISGAIPVGANLVVTAPADAQFVLGTKGAHFVDFTAVEPQSIATEGSNKVYTYFLADAQQYNYRTWKAGGLTNAGVLKMSADEAKRPQLAFADADYTAKDPHFIDRDVTANNKYNVADIFVNINERGHLKLNQGDEYDAMAYRSWEIIDGITTNYFVEPDFHYTVLNTNGQADNSVITVEQGQAGSQWATLKAVGDGTAIVLVTYDALAANQYTDATKKDALGGTFWSAIWPENTAAYVVTVGQPSTAIVSNMKVNEGKNATNLKLAGDNVDAESDVFYYLKGEEGYAFTFAPEGVANVEIAYPTIGAQMATYNGFAADGVTKNADGSYTVLLKQGRQIVKMTDASGNSEYQVLTAKEVEYTIANLTNAESETFAAGDKVAVTFNTLYHPANKIAGIHNFNATIEYTALPEGVKAVKGTANQYQFAATEKAQTYTVTLPTDWDGVTPLVLDGGALRLGMFGDPIGNHRNTSRQNGRNANFTAVQNTSLLCVLPQITIANAAGPAVADFEDITVDPVTGLYQPEDEEDETCYWNSGDYTFSTYTDEWEKKYYYDFVVTNSTSDTYNGLADQYNSACGHAKSGSNYAVWYDNFYGSEGIYLPDAQQISGFYVTNTAWVKHALINGDGLSQEADGQTGKPFGYGNAADKLTLVIKGYDEELEETGTVEYTLAEVKDDKLYYVSDWRWVDLTSLGDNVVNVGFSIKTTKQNYGYASTPTYFCMDDFGGKAPAEDAPMAELGLIVNGITDVTAATANAQRFDLMGRMAGARQGVQIIRSADGRVRKAIIK